MSPEDVRSKKLVAQQPEIARDSRFSIAARSNVKFDDQILYVFLDSLVKILNIKN